MTSRITLAILLTTWAILIIGETAAFLTARQILLALLDDSIVARAATMLERQVNEIPMGEFIPAGDRYVLRDENTGKELARSNDRARPMLRPSLIDKRFETIGHHKLRTVTLRTVVQNGATRKPITIAYSRPADKFERLLSHLAGVLLLISMACGLATAWLALKLSRAALRPLRETAEVIAEIDETHLSRRIDAAALPVELQPMTGRLNEMLARLEGVFMQRKQFLADAAHELRTPTAALLTTLEVALRRPRDQSELIAALQTGLTDAKRLRKLVENLMEQARSEHARGPETMETFDVIEVVRECVTIVEPIAREKQVNIEPDLPDALPLLSQREHLRSILLNVLTNSIEYNHPGGEIRLSCYRVNGSLRLCITDTGQGISAEQLPHVFEPFYRGGHSRKDDASHLGLGLFLVKSHVQALGGQCHLESRLGEGTTLHIILPAPNEPAVRPITLSEPAPASVGASI